MIEKVVRNWQLAKDVGARVLRLKCKVEVPSESFCLIQHEVDRILAALKILGVLLHELLHSFHHGFPELLWIIISSILKHLEQWLDSSELRLRARLRSNQTTKGRGVDSSKICCVIRTKT